MGYKALCPKCQILLFDVPGMEGFGKGEDDVEVTCRSCGGVYQVGFDRDGKSIVFKKDSWKRPKKAIRYA